MIILLRLCCAMLSAYIFVLYTAVPPFPLVRLSQLLNENGEVLWAWYDHPAFDELAFNPRLIAAALWLTTWGLLELRALGRVGQPTPKLLTHLRYGPIAILILSIATIIASDQFLIQYSRWELVRWIHSDAPVTALPPFALHNTDRGWCLNGSSATRYYLYGNTPAAYKNDPDPAIRARALQASMYVYDWINHPNDGPSIAVLQKARTDPNATVREIAAQYSADLHEAH